MTAPTTHWSTTGQLHTGTVAGCETCEEEAELLVSYRAHVGHKPSADEVTVPDTAALDATARTWSRTGGLAPLIDREKARESDSLPPRSDAGPESGPLSHHDDDDGPGVGL